MTTLATLSELMIQVGPLVHAEEVRQFSEKEWGVAFDEKNIIEIEYDEDYGKLVLHSNIGKIDPNEELEVYRLLLFFAYDWKETGGLRMGLSPVDENVHQIFDLPVVGLDLDRLITTLTNFSDAAKHSRNLIENGVTATASDDSSFTGMMRV